MVHAGVHPRYVVFAVIAIAWLLWVYVRYYTTPNPVPSILQTSLDSCTPELLGEKLPVILTDRVTDHRDLLKTVFKYQYIRAGRETACKPEATKATARFTLLYLPDAILQETSHVDVVHPNGTSVRVVLRHGTTLVLPPQWTYRCGPGGVVSVPLYDTYHAISYLFTRTPAPSA
jgi:hypothetical protein